MIIIKYKFKDAVEVHLFLQRNPELDQGSGSDPRQIQAGLPLPPSQLDLRLEIQVHRGLQDWPCLPRAAPRSQ